MSGLVAIIGRPSVGKSTLFNRLIGHRRALVGDVPGVTRDRHYGEAEWAGRRFTVVDTGGFEPEHADTLHERVREQAQAAVEECDLIILVVDARAGLTADDAKLASQLRKSGKPTVLAANKVDSSAQESSGAVADFYSLGLGDVFPISSEHALGLTELLDRVSELLPPEAQAPEEESEEQPTRIAIVGRPNVGKSTLVNALLGKERLVAAEQPGTTRDSIDSELFALGRRFVLTDTAGIRRKKTIGQRVEQFAVLAALKAIERSDVAALVMDATESGVDQDARIARIAEDKGRGLLLVVNKWDQLSQAANQKVFRAELKYRLKFASHAPLLFTSALHGVKVKKVLELGGKLHDQLRFRAPTGKVNRLLRDMMDAHPPPFANGKQLRFYYIAQVGTEPPTFVLTSNSPASVPEHYKRYLVNRLRAAFELRVPIRLLFRERPGGERRAARKGRTGRTD